MANRFLQAAFGAHVCVLGMSTLFTQIYTVVLLVFSTWFLVHDFGFDSGKKYENVTDPSQRNTIKIPFGEHLEVEQENPPANRDKRMLAYVAAGPDQRQEEMLRHWSLLPFHNDSWYKTYEDEKRAKQFHEGLRSAASSPAIASSPSSSMASRQTGSTGSGVPLLPQ